MDRRTRAVAAVGGAAALLVLVQVGALALVAPFEAAGYQSVPDPQDPTNSLVYLGFILVATAGMLAVIKLGAQWALRGALLVASALISWYVFSVVLAPVGALLSVSPALLAAVAAAAFAAAIYLHPEWYVVDAAGVVMGAGAAGLFGISFGVLPTLVLLAALAVYDAISVYGTEHMLTLASSVMEMRVPVVVVVPMTPAYSFRGDERASGDGSDHDGEETEGDGSPAEGPPIEERDAIFVGLGDLVMPTILVASAAFFVDAPSLGVPGVALNLPALGAAVGTLAGMVVLVRMVLKGRAHAGLPLLNGGAILGYVVGALAAGVPLVEALGLGPYL